MILERAASASILPSERRKRNHLRGEMRKATSHGSGPMFDAVRESADAADVDVDDVAGRQVEIVRRHDAGARQQNGALRKAGFLAEPLDQLFEGSLHGADLGSAFERRLAAALDVQA